MKTIFVFTMAWSGHVRSGSGYLVVLVPDDHVSSGSGHTLALVIALIYILS